MKIQIQIPRGDVYRKNSWKFKFREGTFMKKEIQIPRGDVYK